MRKLSVFVFIFILASLAFPKASTTATAAPTLNWSTCGSCPESPEVSVSGNTINLGEANDSEYSSQRNSKHGASALLPPASEYTITYDFSLFTWDSYNPSGYGWSGYWDSFSVGVSSLPYWQMPLSDPVTKSNYPGLGFIWGGTIYADGKLEGHFGQNNTMVVKGNPSGNNYLNVILDTATYPESNHAFPSWGTITIKDVKVGGDYSSNQVIENAKALVGAPYTMGAKGWDYVGSGRWADIQQIHDTGYKYYKAGTGVVTGKGIDCSGLVLRSYNLANGATKLTGGPITYEGADGQYRNCTSAISESELMPGDLLFFDKVKNSCNCGGPDGLMDHVAMYVGNINNGFDVIESTPPNAKWSKKDELKGLPYFKGYGRLKSCAKAMAVQTKSPIYLSVTDPEGYTISPETIIDNGEELLIEIPGILYYSIDENLDDVVYSPVLKPGIYTIKAMPKPDAQSTDTFSIIIEGAAKQIVLAQNVPISEIPPNGYLVMSTGDEIIPIGSQQAPSLSVPGDQVVQYSDNLSFTISASDIDNESSSLIFDVIGLPEGLSFTNNGDGTAGVHGTVVAMPGPYYVYITVTDPDGLTDTGYLTIFVTQEDARTTYTGPLMVSTSCATCTSAVIPLRATIQDITAIVGDPAYDLDAGDITNATVKFVDRNHNDYVLCSTDVILLDPANPTVGTAQCDWSTDIGSNYGMDFTIGVMVDGYYTRNSADENTIINVYKPTSNFITGGGYFVNQNSGGKYAGSPDLKTNFGLNIKFTKKLTNLQGRVTILLRKDGRVYQIKSTALNSLAVLPYNSTNPKSGTAELIGKATVTDVTDPINPMLLEGGAALDIVMKDNGEPGSGDLIGISLWSKDRTLLYSSNWNGRQTINVLLNGGNLSVK